ncbi:translation initiation factor IF-2 [Candidatus Uhrbacteria bacterium]|nr:translation initiation factor IF-2 [Candidatus Uhrbacteria bacterium]
MNISELARKLKVTTNQLHDVLPLMGIDVGKRAVKIDDTLAHRVMKNWSQYSSILKKQRAVQETDKTAQEQPHEKQTVRLPHIMTVRDFSVLLNIPVTKLIQVLMNNGILAALNEKIDFDTASIIAEDLGFIPEHETGETIEEAVSGTDIIKETMEKEQDALLPRPPVIVVMGHVDHGKTKLLDSIRKTNVIAQESGGITQHIGAYQVTKLFKNTGEEKTLTFLDTPGHEAFTTMRSRGARIADIAILVVAADDGVKPQTVEAIKIIKAAGLPVVVAINKIDKSDANLDRTKRELSEQGLIPEDWSGNTICVPISAKQGIGIDELLEIILLVSDMEKANIMANPHGETIGTIIESHIDKHEGPVATLIVQNGTLHKNDYLVIDNVLYGKIRAMKDYRGKLIETALPSQPVKIIGFKAAPVVGYIVRATGALGKGFESVEKDIKRSAAASIVVTPRIIEEESAETSSVNIILKTDTLGSLEAITNALTKIDHPEVKVKIVSRDIGAITSTDILNAEATHSFIAGFHVTAGQSALQIASEKNVEVKLYKIIYELIDDVKERIEALLSPEIHRVILGTLSVMAIFRTDHASMIIGGRVDEGIIEQGARTQVMRGGERITEGKISKIQSGKQEISQAKSGQEVGIAFDGKPLIQRNDILQTYKDERKKRTLE